MKLKPLTGVLFGAHLIVMLIVVDPILAQREWTPPIPLVFQDPAVTESEKGSKAGKAATTSPSMVGCPDCLEKQKSNQTEKTQKDKNSECKGQLSTLPIRPFGPLGHSPVLQTGPGYYSFWDFVTGNYRQKSPKRPYSPISPIANSFYDADFRYLDDPQNKQTQLFDPLHQISFGQNWYFSTGGEFRWRSMNERNRRFTGVTNNYDLLRTRVYGDLWYKNSFRIFGEFHHAEIANQDLPPLLIDVNRSDFLNLFFDLKVANIADAPVYVRGGRQELYLGSQRLISPLDWVNSRRTFQGVRVFRPGKKVDVDLFWVQPVVPERNELDSVDNDQNFAGAWVTYRPKKGHSIDGYYLFLDDTSPIPILDAGSVATNTHTNWYSILWEEEQFPVGFRRDVAIW